MNDQERNAAYGRVREGLGMADSQESIREYCLRAVWRFKGRKRRAATVLLRDHFGDDAWRDIIEADRILRGIDAP